MLRPWVRFRQVRFAVLEKKVALLLGLVEPSRPSDERS
jgi:hypothetical protein